MECQNLHKHVLIGREFLSQFRKFAFHFSNHSIQIGRHWISCVKHREKEFVRLNRKTSIPHASKISWNPWQRTKLRYLGGLVDNSLVLDWKEHIKKISSKIFRAILSIAFVKTLYWSIVQPHLRYCFSVWGYFGEATINKLQKRQNRAARILAGNSFNNPGGPLI